MSLEQKKTHNRGASLISKDKVIFLFTYHLAFFSITRERDESYVIC